WQRRWFSTQALLLRDLALLATVYFVGYRLAGIQSLLDIVSAVPQTPAAAASSSPLVTVFFFALLLVLCGALAIIAGTLWFALFVHANESASGLFSPWTAVNHAVAMCLNTAMLVPYKPKRAGCPYEAPAIRPCLFDCCFRFLHLAGANCWQTSFFACLAFFCALAYSSFSLGFLKEVVIFYVAPYFVCNVWMAYYYGLLESGGPHDVANEENAVNFKFASPLALRWMKQVHEERCSKGQDGVGGVMWKGIDSLHHHLPRKHLVQALTFGVSRQGICEATRIIGQRLETLPGDFTVDAASEEEAATAAPSTPQSPTDLADSLEVRETEFAKCPSC
ncbi:fatty acyl, partial [Cystoisospora suis]